MSKYYSSVSVGGYPDDAAFLSRELSDKLRSIQKNCVVEQIDSHTIGRAWSCKESKYLPALEYIIIYSFDVDEGEE